MRLVASDLSDVHENFFTSASLVPRLVLGKGDVFRLPAMSHGIEVVAGMAWVTANGRDIFLVSGERLLLPARRDSVLISALGRNSLILEVFGANFAPAQAMLSASLLE